MNCHHSRREFLADVGRGALIATLGAGVAADLGLASARADESPASLAFGSLEPLVRLMQETPPDRLLPKLVAELARGVTLRDLTAAAALANARTFGGEDYVGFHTMMALAPAFHMSRELPEESRALPILKVLYRNTARIQEHGGRKSEVLLPVAESPAPVATGGESLRAAVRANDLAKAEQILAAATKVSPDEAFNELLIAVEDQTEVHRVVLPYRTWDLLGLIGRDQAHTLLRQSVHYCVKAGASQNHEAVALLPKLLDEHKLDGRESGTRRGDDAWLEELSSTIFKSTPAQAASAAAAALSDGFSPDCIGEAMTLAANQLILRDMGRRPFEEIAGKPLGSVHGDSIGVHAGDSANAWRNMARVSNTRNTRACLILGAYQVALDRVNRGGDFLTWQPLPVPHHLDQLKSSAPDDLLRELDEAVRGNLQAHACAIVHRYGSLGHPSRPLFDLLLRYAVSEDGALHAEKFYRSTSEEFAGTREKFRWRYAVALARVTASEFGRPAAGMAEARALLKV